jgi:Uma2 family endonuclease
VFLPGCDGVDRGQVAAEALAGASGSAVLESSAVTSPALTLCYAYRDYVQFERDARERHEFVGGLILAMAGGTLEHARLTAAIIATLSSQLQGKRCAVFDSNARVRVQASGNAFYPDASIVCGSAETDPEDRLSMLNPTALVEVLSPSTAQYDRTEKLTDYQSIESLRYVIHVAHDQHRIEVWTRAEQGWTTSVFRAGDSAALTELGCSLDVDAIYRDPLATG